MYLSVCVGFLYTVVIALDPSVCPGRVVHLLTALPW